MFLSKRFFEEVSFEEVSFKKVSFKEVSFKKVSFKNISSTEVYFEDVFSKKFLLRGFISKRFLAKQQQDILLFFPLRPFLSLPFSLPSQRIFPISFKTKVGSNEKCKRKPGIMKSGVDATPLFLQDDLLSKQLFFQISI